VTSGNTAYRDFSFRCCPSLKRRLHQAPLAQVARPFRGRQAVAPPWAQFLELAAFVERVRLVDEHLPD
jgi:hypothetical protein